LLYLLTGNHLLDLPQTCVVAITRPGEVGEVPFAVSRSFRKMTEDEILHHVETQLGEAYCLGGAILLSDTGLPEFPVNQTHKIDKAKLRQTVMEYLGNRENS
jgi:4-coumarate--CoA ligase